jgi:hypothetical protein
VPLGFLAAHVVCFAVLLSRAATGGK